MRKTEELHNPIQDAAVTSCRQSKKSLQFRTQNSSDTLNCRSGYHCAAQVQAHHMLRTTSLGGLRVSFASHSLRAQTVHLSIYISSKEHYVLNGSYRRMCGWF